MSTATGNVRPEEKMRSTLSRSGGTPAKTAALTRLETGRIRVLQGGAMPVGYALVMSPPPVEDYLHLRVDAGLSPKTEEQAVAGLPGSWAACHVVYELTDQVVGMGRVLGDGGWYFHVVDMAVHPGHQRRGLGDAILTALLEHVRVSAPGGAYVNLLADPPGRRLYARHGFAETAPGSVGMALTLG